MSRLSTLRALSGAFLLVACVEDDARRHVFSSPPPATPRPAATARVPAVPHAVQGASAKIDAVRVASTGAPASLGDVTEPVELLVLVRRDESTSRDMPLRIELHLTGEADTTLVVPLEPPVPTIVATPIRVPVSPAPGALPDGRYSAQVLLVTAGGRVLATSIPVPFVVRTAR